MEAYGVTTDFVSAEGETRINTVIIDESTGEHTTITSASMFVKPSHLDALRQRYARALGSATVLITGGSLPPGMEPEFYVEAINMARAQGVPVLFDASQPNLGVGLEAKPSFIKPNHHELSALVGQELDSTEALHAAGSDILARYGSEVVISRGKKGVLAVLREGSYRIPADPGRCQQPGGRRGRAAGGFGACHSSREANRRRLAAGGGRGDGRLPAAWDRCLRGRGYAPLLAPGRVDSLPLSVGRANCQLPSGRSKLRVKSPQDNPDRAIRGKAHVVRPDTKMPSTRYHPAGANNATRQRALRAAIPSASRAPELSPGSLPSNRIGSGICQRYMPKRCWLW